MAGRGATEIVAVYLGERFRFEGNNGSGDTVIGRALMAVEESCEAAKAEKQKEAEETTTAITATAAKPKAKRKTEITIKGKEFPSQQLLRRKQYRFFGRWRDYTNKRTGQTEKQFHFDSYVETEPAGREAVVAYLLDAVKHARVRLNGKTRMNFGPAKANKLWDAFGEDAIKTCREDVDATMEAAGIKLRFVAEALAAELKRRQGTERCVMDLLALFAGRGIPKRVIPLALERWGNRAAEIVNRNPYVLMRFPGVGFTTADKLYLSLGHDPKRLKRLAYRIWHAIASRGSGDTWVRASDVARQLASDVGPEKVSLAMQLAKRGKLIRVARVDGHGCLTEQAGEVLLSVYREGGNEIEVAEIVAANSIEQPRWPAVDGGDLTPHQREEISKALTGSIAMLVGSPGCGKTYSAARIIQAIINTCGKDSIAVAAPTGKAAVRMTESLNDAGIKITARTIHSLLKVESAGDNGGGWRFVHGQDKPLPFKFLVIDESSMVDVDLMASLLRACERGTHVLFVGDTNQLPPVGHGAPLRDFIRSGLPCGELTEILRNDGGIVQACADMRDGKEFSCGGNLEHINASGELAFSAIHQLIDYVSSELGMDAIWDFQIVVPINEKSPVSRKKFNEFLQRELNSKNATKGSPFWPEDKVVNTSNSRLPELDLETERRTGEEVYVANGELGKVVKAEKSHFVVRLWAPDRLVLVPRGQEGNGCAWDLGYALSCHRCQGSEWPLVAVVLDESPAAKRVCDRSWLYTAISRAKKHCWLVGKLPVAHSMCRRQQLHRRRTLLVERINQERSRFFVGEI